jgi:hypothetical protein
VEASPPAAAPQRTEAQPDDRSETQPCPGCGHDMPALKGARLSICPVCGYKESCCY